MERLSKTVLTSGSKFADLVGSLVDQVEASRSATAKVEKNVERQKKFVSVVEKLANNALHDVASLRGRVSVASTRETELLYSASTASSHIEKATEESYQARDTISTHSRELAKIALLKKSIKSLENNVAFN